MADGSGLLNQLLQMITSLLGNNSPQTQAPMQLEEPDTNSSTSQVIAWANELCDVTGHFTVKDALMLHSWNRLGTEQDGADFGKLITLCEKMEQIRDILGCPINVHCMFRSQDYNNAQNIKPAADVHSMSLACDFDCNGHLSIQEIKDRLEPLLEDLKIRMEYGTTTWVHIDLHEVGPSGRYFKV